MNNLKNLTYIEKERLIKFQNLTYIEKEKLKATNSKRFNNLIKLQERQNESLVIISHQKYRRSSSEYNNKITTSINPAFFISIKYIDSVATTPERVISMFSNIKYQLTRTKDYKFQHHVEKGLDGSYHSHLFVSSLKNQSKQKQINWFICELEKYRIKNKYSISNSNDSIDVQIFDNKELNLPPSLRTSYIRKQDNRSYLSLDISPNTDNLYAV